MKNKISLILILFSAVYCLSCEEYLEEELISGVSAGTYYTTASGFEAALAATYAEPKSFYGTERGFTMTVFGTDLHTNGRGGSHKMINYYDGAFSPAQSFVRDTWRDFYRGINQANAVINRSENVEGVTQEVKTTRIAEVRFLRALFYFNLVQFFGDIHLSLDETVGVEIDANRTPASQIYTDAIIPDLEFAIDNLPDSQNEYGRATKPAAEFLLAKVYMTRAYKTYGAGNADATEAARLMGNVIDNYDFSLLPDFADLWDINNERNSEVIFAIQNNKNQVDEGLDTQGHSGHLYFLMEYDILPGMARDTENGRPWIRFRPTEFLLGLWDREFDARYDKTYKHAWISNTESSIPVWTSEDASKGYVYPTLNKWIDPTRPNRQHTPGQRNHPLMRLADAYLIRAEARIMQNELSAAADDINTVRRRGAWTGKEEAIEISPEEATLEFLLDERGRELVGEGHRWFDLTRTGKLVERVRAHNPEGRNNIQDYHILRPIPLEQIDRTSGGYQQNCGYIGADC